MMFRRYEVRVRVCATGEDSPDGSQKFFFRRFAEDWCWRMNSVRSILGHDRITYYVHDLKGDK